MKVEIDMNANAAYIIISDAPVAETVEVTETVFVDLDKYAMTVGVEVLGLEQSVNLDVIIERCHVHADKHQMLQSALDSLKQVSVMQAQATSDSRRVVRGNSSELGKFELA